MKVAPDGSTVLVTGTSDGGPGTGSDWATVAYPAATGTQRWVSRYTGPGNGDDGASSLAVNPRGTRVYVTGFSEGRTSGRDCATVAHRTATGAQVWAKRYTGPGTRTDAGYGRQLPGPRQPRHLGLRHYRLRTRRVWPGAAKASRP